MSDLTDDRLREIAEEASHDEPHLCVEEYAPCLARALLAAREEIAKIAEMVQSARRHNARLTNENERLTRERNKWRHAAKEDGALLDRAEAEAAAHKLVLARLDSLVRRCVEVTIYEQDEGHDARYRLVVVSPECSREYVGADIGECLAAEMEGGEVSDAES